MLHLQLQLRLHFTFRFTFTRAYLHLDLNLQCITSQYSTVRNSQLHHMHNMYTVYIAISSYDLNVISLHPIRAITPWNLQGASP